jgi:hypothetical protein
MGFVLYSIFLLIYLPKEIISGLQRCLDSLQNYCGDWRLAVNLTKTKVIIFSKKAIEKYSHYFYYEPNEYRTNPIERIPLIRHPGTALSSSVGLSHGNPAIAHKDHGYKINMIISIIF